MTPDSSTLLWPRSIVLLARTVIGVTIVAALVWARVVLIPVALATLLTILLNPIVRVLQKRGLGRMISVFLVVTTAAVSLTAVGIIGSQQITRLMSELPQNTAKIIAKVRTLKAVASGPAAKQFEQMIEEISSEIQQTPAAKPEKAEKPESQTSSTPTVERIVMASEAPWSRLSGPLGSLVEVMATLAFTFVLLVFFLLESKGLRDRVALLAGKTRLTLTNKALEDATFRVGRYIVMVEIINGGFGLILSAGLFLLGVPYAVLWGCVAALLRFLPYIGPWVGAIFPIAMSMATSDGWWQPMAVFGFVLALELVTNNAIEPILFGHTTGVAPTALLISAAFWLYIWGPIGLVMSAPFAVSLVVIGKNIPQLSFLNILLGDQPALSDEVSFYQRLLVQDQQEATTLIAQRVKQSTIEKVVDELLIPALNYTKRDLRRGHLKDEDVDHVVETLQKGCEQADLSARELNQVEPTQLPQVTRPRLKLFGWAADGEVDREALNLLQLTVDSNQWEMEVISEETLTSELVARVLKEAPDAICVGAIPPGGIAHARYVCKKIRAAVPGIPIVVGRWGSKKINPTDRERLAESGANATCATLKETRQWLESRASLVSQSNTEATPSPKYQPDNRATPAFDLAGLQTKPA